MLSRPKADSIFYCCVLSHDPALIASLTNLLFSWKVSRDPLIELLQILRLAYER